MCEKGNIEGDSSSMGTLVNGSEVFNECNSVTAASGDSGSTNRVSNLNFGPKFRVLKRTDQVSVIKISHFVICNLSIKNR
jgi:hypothetical protein